MVFPASIRCRDGTGPPHACCCLVSAEGLLFADVREHIFVCFIFYFELKYSCHRGNICAVDEWS